MNPEEPQQPAEGEEEVTPLHVAFNRIQKLEAELINETYQRIRTQEALKDAMKIVRELEELVSQSQRDESMKQLSELSDSTEDGPER